MRGVGLGPLFKYENGRALTRQCFVLAVRDALKAGGVDASSYTGHSFQIGAATAVAKVGMQDSLIRTLGRSESLAFLLYIRIPLSMLQAVAETLVRE